MPEADLTLTPKDIQRFWSKVDVRGPEECWPWKGKPDVDGYGKTKVHGVTVRVHRLSWILTYGMIPILISGETACICHDCPDGDNRICANPGHLWLGSNADNIHDANHKGMYYGPKSEEHRRKLRISARKANQVSAIRSASKTTCKNGHAYEPENTYRYKGKRQCHTCRHEADRRRWAKKIPY